MEVKDIVFNEDLDMYVFLEDLNCEIGIVLSDDLEASEEKLAMTYRAKIATFINDLSQWYDKVCMIILEWAKDIYQIDAKIQDLKLMNIYILFEQNEDELFGLDFRVEFDIEHGCGLRIKGKKENYEVVEVGMGDVAY